MGVSAPQAPTAEHGRILQRLKENGKPPKVAITAVMRKLLILANTLIAQNRQWSPNPA